jgi:hypothetical protein
MKYVRVDLNEQGVAELLKSPEVLADLERRANAIADAAGGEPEDYEVVVMIGRTRARASIRTASHRARAAEARERRLTRSFEAGRR